MADMFDKRTGKEATDGSTSTATATSAPAYVRPLETPTAIYPTYSRVMSQRTGDQRERNPSASGMTEDERSSRESWDAKMSRHKRITDQIKRDTR